MEHIHGHMQTQVTQIPVEHAVVAVTLTLYCVYFMDTVSKETVHTVYIHNIMCMLISAQHTSVFKLLISWTRGYILDSHTQLSSSIKAS